MCFFFFKQKTAYEMRIRDGSSDVGSSDLNLAQWACPLHCTPRIVRAHQVGAGPQPGLAAEPAHRHEPQAARPMPLIAEETRRHARRGTELRAPSPHSFVRSTME